MEPLWIVAGVGWLLLIGLGVYVAGEKGRATGEAVALAALFGPLGVLVVALLPTIDDEAEMERLAARNAAADALAVAGRVRPP
jgi:hypothetical protein